MMFIEPLAIDEHKKCLSTLCNITVSVILTIYKK